MLIYFLILHITSDVRNATYPLKKRMYVFKLSGLLEERFYFTVEHYKFDLGFKCAR